MSFFASSTNPWSFGLLGYEGFPHPFIDLTSHLLPNLLPQVFDLCQFVVNTNGTYRSALQRVLSYFITDVQVGDDATGDDEREKWERFLNDLLKIKKVLFDFGMNYLTYGNAFVSVLPPFRRYLICPKCRTTHPLSVVAREPAYKFRWVNFEFHAYCPNRDVTTGEECAYQGAWEVKDIRVMDEKEIRVRFWPPQEIEIKYDDLTGDKTYIWKIPEDYKRKVREGHVHFLERVHEDVLKCIKLNQNLEFEPGAVFHLYDPPLAGHKTYGWGLPRVLTNFRLVLYNQLLTRYNEAIAMDYVIPFRVITPAPSPGGADGVIADPLRSMNAGGFMARVRAMLRQRRRNPTEWFSLPFPIQYQVLGGEAKALAPVELLDQGISMLLNAIGVPFELYKGNLSVQAAPAALRLFETSWTHLVHGLNEFLQQLVDQVSLALNWESVPVKLLSPKITDDINDQMAKLQLMSGRQISQTTGLQALGLDFKAEQRRIMEEERYVQEQMAKIQKEMEQMQAAEQLAPPMTVSNFLMQQQQQQQAAMQGQAPPAGGAPGSPAAPGAMPGMDALSQALSGPQQGQTPSDLIQQAQSLAPQLLQLTESQRQSMMRQLKATNPTLHALVKQMIQDQYQQMRTQGKQMLMQQQFGGT
jgi:hypothetical protein